MYSWLKHKTPIFRKKISSTQSCRDLSVVKKKPKNNTFSHYPHIDSSTESKNVPSPRRRRAEEGSLFIPQREKSKWKQVQVEMVTFWKLIISKDERFRACLVLAASGDAIGFYSGEWETCTEGEEILRQVQLMGGLETFNIGGWEVSE